MYRPHNNYLEKFNHLRKRYLSNRNFLIVAAILVGICAGLAAAVLKLLTHHIASFLQNDLQWQYKYVLYLFFPLIGILLSVLYVRRFIRKKKFETGLTPILYTISKKSSRMDFHNIYSQIITTALTIGFGGSTGLESPIVSSGSTIGSRIGSALGLNYRENTLLLACGAASGIAGAFNSPIAGIVFAIEVLLPEFSIPAFIPLLISAATASVIARLIYNEQLFYLVSEGWETKALLFYILMAIIIGLFSIYFAKINYSIKHQFAKIKNTYNKAITGGLILGGLIFLLPALYGEGYLTIKELLAGNYESLLANSVFPEYKHFPLVLIAFTVVTIFGKSIATIVTLTSGGNGGIFGPSLIMGGLLGFVFSYSINQTGLTHLNVSNFIVAGMAASLSGIMHAPMTGIFLIAEVTGGYVLMIPLMIVSATSYLINKASQKYSIYTKGLAEKGDLLSYEDRDRTILNMMRLKYVIDKDFVPIYIEKDLDGYRDAVIRSRHNIFPVLDNERKLLGIIRGENLFNAIFNKKEIDFRVEDITEQPFDLITDDENMNDVMKKMDKDDIWLLPVVDKEGKYKGFVSKTTIFNKYRALSLRQKKYLE